MHTPLGPLLHFWNTEVSVFQWLLYISVGMAIHICAVEWYEDAFKSSSLLYAGGKRAFAS